MLFEMLCQMYDHTTTIYRAVTCHHMGFSHVVLPSYKIEVKYKYNSFHSWSGGFLRPVVHFFSAHSLAPCDTHPTHLTFDLPTQQHTEGEGEFEGMEAYKEASKLWSC